jgi:hypothetical protein
MAVLVVLGLERSDCRDSGSLEPLVMAGAASMHQKAPLAKGGRARHELGLRCDGSVVIRPEADTFLSMKYSITVPGALNLCRILMDSVLLLFGAKQND